MIWIITYLNHPSDFKTETKKVEEENMNGNNRNDVKIGSSVLVVEKQNQRSGTTTEGVVKKILTNSQNHPHGIKVMLEDGIVGRVKQIK